MSFFSPTTYIKIETSFYEPIYGNYYFDTDLTDFGIVRERKFSKVNRSGSVLKLGEIPDTNSIYPMLDEFGYTFRDFFIFRSTWDFKYHIETYVGATDQISSNTGKYSYGIEQALMDLQQGPATIGRTMISTNNQFE